MDRVHAHFAGMAARTAYWIEKFFGIPYSVTAHANDIFAAREFVVSLAKIFDAAAAIVTVSDFSVGQLEQRFPSAAHKIQRVYNGIELERFSPATFDAPVPIVLSIGRLIEKKGFADLISACAILKTRGLKFRCHIIGEGPLESSLAAQIGDAQLGEHVQLLGARSQREIRQHLAAANLFVLPCTTEADGGMDNLPTVIMEAMAAGLPVISTPLAGVPEMVLPGVTGALVPQRDPHALAGALERLIVDREEAQQLGARGREVAAEKFSVEANARALTAILCERR
jgi:glycosyltransferase involved in cell wall biosynthesis